MELNQQVVSLELSKKLKELGCKQESLWYWNKDTDDPYEINNWKGKFEENSYSAFTCSELGEMLPETTKSYRLANEYFCDYSRYSRRDRDTEVNARGRCLIMLLEQGIISVEDINKKHAYVDTN